MKNMINLLCLDRLLHLHNILTDKYQFHFEKVDNMFLTLYQNNMQVVVTMEAMEEKLVVDMEVLVVKMEL